MSDATGSTTRQEITDQDLIGITDDHIRQAIGYMGGKLADQRLRNEQYYLALPAGDLAPSDIDGRSAVVSTDVADTVEWMLPSLVKTFTGGENVVEFTPRSEGQEEKAQLATEYVNYVIHKQNPGFQIIHTWIKDALIQKTGILKVWWDDSTEDLREVYRGLTEQQAAMLLEDPEVEPVEHSAYVDEEAAKQDAEHYAQAVQMAMQQGQQPPVKNPPPMLHDITVKRRKKVGKVCVENVPPEEFLIDRRAKTIQTAAFVGHRVEKTISDLRAMRYANIDEIGSDSTDNAGAMSAERIERRSFDDEMPYMFGQDVATTDESQRVVWVTECYLRIDYNGDGISEWRKVVRCGGTILENVECDGPPFVSITPILLPHRFFGLCPADQAIEVQKLKTSLLRATLDGLYHSVNGRTYAIDGQVNLDDLLTSRPGGVVRIKSAGAVGPLMEGRADLGAAQSMLEYAETMRENRTGWTRYSQGMNADALNQTLGGMNIITNRGDMRVEMIARVFAETGFRDLFVRVLKLISEYQDKTKMARVTGEWFDIDPREWSTQFDFTVNTGLGSNNKDQILAHLSVLAQAQEKVLPLGLAGPKELYNAAKKLCETLGFKNPESYFKDPSKSPPPPPPPNPEALKAQAQAQIEQGKAQATMQIEQAKIQAQMQLAEMQAQVQQQTELAAQQAQQAQVEAQAQVDMQVAMHKAQLDAQVQAQKLEFDRWKAELESQTRILVAEISAGARRDAMAQKAEETPAGEAE